MGLPGSLQVELSRSIVSAVLERFGVSLKHVQDDEIFYLNDATNKEDALSSAYKDLNQHCAGIMSFTVKVKVVRMYWLDVVVKH